MEQLLDECRLLVSCTKFDEIYKEIEGGHYNPFKLVDICLALIFITVERDTPVNAKSLEILSKALGMLRSSMLEDDDEKFPMTVLNLKHIVASLQKIWILSDVKDEPPSHMYS